ncbi:MAG: alpha/beta fold hydrolase [Rubrivivax sp.]|nr:alpha/beta fold hydrolase [Rubrivivax sp.]
MFDLFSTTLTAATGLTLAYGAIAAVAADRFTRTPRRVAPGVPHPEHAPQEVCLASRGTPSLMLSGWYFEARAARGAIVMVHGVGGHKGLAGQGTQAALLSRLVAAGWSILAIDLRGHGESSPGRMSYGLHESQDVLGAVDWLLERGFKPGSIGLLGASMGAVASIVAASREPAVGAVVADSAFADFGAMLQRHFLRRAPLKLGRALLPGTMVAGRVLVGAFMHRFRPASLAEQLRNRPLLLIHAEGDRLVPSSDCEELARAAQAECWVTPGGAHLSSCVDAGEQYVERVCAFFERHLPQHAQAQRLPGAAGRAPGQIGPLLAEHEVDVPRLLSLFKQAGQPVEVGEQGQLIVTADNGVRMTVWVDEAQRLIHALAVFGLRAEAPHAARLDLINRINDSTVYVRWCVSDAGSLHSDVALPFDGGIATASILSGLHRLATISVHALRHDAEAPRLLPPAPPRVMP